MASRGLVGSLPAMAQAQQAANVRRGVADQMRRQIGEEFGFRNQFQRQGLQDLLGLDLEQQRRQQEMAMQLAQTHLIPRGQVDLQGLLTPITP